MVGFWFWLRTAPATPVDAVVLAEAVVAVVRIGMPHPVLGADSLEAAFVISPVLLPVDHVVMTPVVDWARLSFTGSLFMDSAQPLARLVGRVTSIFIQFHKVGYSRM